MNTFRMISATVLAAGLMVSAGSTFAAQTWTNAPKGIGIDIATFVAQLGTFDATDVEALVNAKSVAVVTYSDAWASASENKNAAADQAQAMDKLTADTGEIEKFRAALKANPKANPKAMKLLEGHKVALKNVIDIVQSGKGDVQLYVQS